MSLSDLVRLATLLGAIAFAGAAHALTYAKYSEEGPDENAILASGNIEPDEAFRFQTYLSKLPPKSQTSLYLNSTGGNVQGAIAMGRVVHAARIRTYVTSPSARCNSACTSIFLAGRDRETGKPYRVKGSNNPIGFHNFVPILEDKPYTAKDVANVMSRAQSTIYEIANYYQEIDANLELLGLGLKQKDVYYLPNQDALRYGIHVLDASSNELIRYETFIRYLNP
ncbi:MAG TPA: hypothetical protein VK438_14670 [Xanthobacteraceae bacterium]|nr:hypothetical protein [Xanthobacteraceae bacterium]